MNDPLDSFLYKLSCFGVLWLATLWVASRFGRPAKIAKLCLGAAALTLIFAPPTGLPILKWAFGVCPNPSIPLIVIIGLILYQRVAGTELFPRREWRCVWAFGALAGTLLYVYPLMFESPDIYYWGWNHALAVWTVAGLAIAFLCWGNRFGLIFLAALAAYELKALESPNGWDYIVDPLYWLTSCGVIATRGVTRWIEFIQKKKRPSNPAATPRSLRLDGI